MPQQLCLPEVQRITSQPDPERGAMEAAVKEGKRMSESEAAEEQQQIEAQADSTMRLQVAQARVNEKNCQLDLLINELKEP